MPADGLLGVGVPVRGRGPLLKPGPPQALWEAGGLGARLWEQGLGGAGPSSCWVAPGCQAQGTAVTQGPPPRACVSLVPSGQPEPWGPGATYRFGEVLVSGLRKGFVAVMSPWGWQVICQESRCPS